MFCSGGALLAVIDAQTGRLPKRINWVTFAGVQATLFIATCWLGWEVLIDASLGALLAGSLFFCVWRKTDLGFGDVRLATLIGLTSGSLAVTACFVALFVGTAIGALLGVIRKVRRKQGGYPFGPALVGGCLCCPLVMAVLT
ncbi:MAG: A24 family peptidase [Propionibacteriaceae bacterium]|nr:A24 family peptidase [Propionibacteriaceae bacterium]